MDESPSGQRRHPHRHRTLAPRWERSGPGEGPFGEPRNRLVECEADKVMRIQSHADLCAYMGAHAGARFPTSVGAFPLLAIGRRGLNGTWSSRPDGEGSQQWTDGRWNSDPGCLLVSSTLQALRANS